MTHVIRDATEITTAVTDMTKPNRVLAVSIMLFTWRIVSPRSVSSLSSSR